MQKHFDTLLEEFRRYSQIDPAEVSLRRCQAVYIAVSNMEEAAKRSKLTFQNIGIAVEKLPEEMRCSHGTLKNDKVVEMFVNFIIDSKNGNVNNERLQKKIDDLNQRIEELQNENCRLSEENLMTKNLEVKLIEEMQKKEQYKALYNRANARLHKINDYSLDSEEVALNMPNIVEFIDGSVVDISTGEIIKSAS